MGRWSSVLLVACLGLLACQSPRTSLVEYRNAELGIALRHPQGWDVLVAPEGNWVQIVPSGAGPHPDPYRYAEFISVRVLVGQVSSSEEVLRQLAFSLLPFHGVAKFQREEVPGPERYRFEGTGTAAEAQWAGIGLLVVDPGRVVHVVCAKPVERWRQGQRECDAVIGSVQLLTGR
ncbi:MAG: hypothetical protein QN193_03055 [Armatimonadota bacterium]|nr:hypothetical protein [Armatimonadota bacterium]MDR7444149.1 hypothetical protein [Armatimonadota bacterium]MDR7569566.1 hypothetical protein [Armatimonadota bacterium]MDR7613598.1 hypothetical protein [Armatimonadota bacterium]